MTAAAVAHVNRLPLLLIPGDVFANRGPDPVLQQVEDFGDGTVSANDCLRPVSRYFDRLTRPEQVMSAFARAMAVLTDPAECGPVTLAFCQDTQTEAFDYPLHFFEPRVWTPRRPAPDRTELAAATALLRGARKPFVVVGGGVLYGEGEKRVDPILRGAWLAARRNPGRQIGDFSRTSSQYGFDRRDRNHGRQYACRRGGRGPGGRHPASGLHHGIAHPVPRAGTSLSSA